MWKFKKFSVIQTYKFGGYGFLRYENKNQISEATKMSINSFEAVNLISRKIWEVEKFATFHTVVLAILISLKLEGDFIEGQIKICKSNYEVRSPNL